MPEITVQLISQVVILLIHINGMIREFQSGPTKNGIFAIIMVFLLFYLAGTFSTILPYPWR